MLPYAVFNGFDDFWKIYDNMTIGELYESYGGCTCIIIIPINTILNKDRVIAQNHFIKVLFERNSITDNMFRLDFIAMINSDYEYFKDTRDLPKRTLSIIENIYINANINTNSDYFKNFNKKILKSYNEYLQRFNNIQIELGNNNA